MSYLYTKALLRIWFSNDPKKWMHQKNQLRLIAALQGNPGSTITLLTRTSILSTDAQQAMWKFKEQYKNLVIIDIDDLLSTLTHTIDKKLAKFALQELKAKQPAAARDLLTLIPNVLMLGSYTDFEVEVKTQDQPDYIELNCPDAYCLLPLRFEKPKGPQDPNAILFTDIMLITSRKKRPAIEKEIRKAVQRAIDQVINHYENPGFFIEKLKKILGPIFTTIINNNITMQATIPAFRATFLEACSYENWLKALKYFTRATTLADLRRVTCIKGPDINPKGTDEEFLRACFSREKRRFEKEFTIQASGPGAYSEIIVYEPRVNHSIVHHDLSKIFFSSVFLPAENRNICSDLSWTQAGQQAMNDYDLAAEKAALVIQKFMPRIPELKKSTPKPIKPHTPLPTILLFERHWESLPKKILRAILEKYAGYNALCIETPHDAMEPQIISNLDTVLAKEKELEQTAKQFLSTISAQQYLSQTNLSLEIPWEDWLFDDLELCLRNLFSSKMSPEYAKTLKDLVAKIYYQKTLLDFQTSISIIGIDIAQDDYRALTDAPTIRGHSEVIQALEEQRNQQLFKGLMQARVQNEGTIMLCGALHAEYFIKMIQEKGLEDQFVIRFIHTDRSYARDLNEISIYGPLIELYRKQQKDSPETVQIITNDIMNEVKQKNKTFIDKPIPRTTTSAYLEAFLGTPCLPRSRPGMHIDACFNRRLSADEKARLPETSFDEIERNGKFITVIRDINTKEVAEKIRSKATLRPK